MSKMPVRRLGVPLAVLLLSLTVTYFGALERLSWWTTLSRHTLFTIVSILGWLAGTVVVCRLTELIIWGQLSRASGRATPRLLIQLTNLLIYFSAAFGMAATLFNVPLTGAIATSSVIGLVIGFAVKSLISDTFSGIALNLDRGFGINDYVQILSRGTPGRITGRVTEINWRSTYLLTPENSMMVIPNTLMSEAIVINFSKPESASEFEMIVSLDLEISSERALRVLTAVIQAAARENPAIFDVKARISEATGNGINYKIKYMLDPARLAPGKAKHLILSHLLRHLTTTGLTLAHPKIDNWNVDLTEADRLDSRHGNRTRLLRQIDLFKGLEDDVVADLAERITERKFAAGAAVMTAGEPGQSMFVMSEGLVSVQIAAEDRDIDVASLSPGEFFGEMSLLTGEPRTATIIAVTDTVAFEIDRSDIEPMLDGSPSTASILSVAAAERRLSSDAARSRPPEELAAERKSLANKILAGMSRFLGRRPATVKVAQK